MHGDTYLLEIVLSGVGGSNVGAIIVYYEQYTMFSCIMFALSVRCVCFIVIEGVVSNYSIKADTHSTE